MFRSPGEFYRVPKYKEDKPCHQLYSCDLCDDGGWSSETDLEIHKKGKHFNRLNVVAINHSRKNPVCMTCVKKMKNLPTLIEHIKTEHLLSSEKANQVEREIYICDYCRQIFFNKSHLAVHIAGKHTKINNVDCPLCPKTMTIQNMFRHLLMHNLKSVSCCPICLTKCANRSAVNEHLKTHAKHFQCKLCGYNTSREENFKWHTDESCKRTVREAEKPWVECRRYFLLPKNRRKYRYPSKWSGIQGLSLWNTLYICLFCRQICVTCESAADHMRYHGHRPLAVKKKHYMCSCGEEFFNAVLLKHHVFKMKGSHRVLSEDEISSMTETEEIEQKQESENPEISKEDRMFVIVIKETETKDADSGEETEGVSKLKDSLYEMMA